MLGGWRRAGAALVVAGVLAGATPSARAQEDMGWPEGVRLIPGRDGEAPTLVIGPVSGAGAPTPDAPGPVPEASLAELDRRSRIAQDEGDLVQAFRASFQAYVRDPTLERATESAGLADRVGGASAGARRSVTAFARGLADREPHVHQPWRALASLPLRENRPGTLQISAAGDDRVYTAEEVEALTWGRPPAPPAPRVPFADDRPQFLRDLQRAVIAAAARQVLRVNREQGPRPAFDLAVAAARLVRQQEARRAPGGFPVLHWPRSADVRPLDDTLGMAPIPFEQPRQGSAALKSWLLGDREETGRLLDRYEDSWRRRRMVQARRARLYRKSGSKIPPGLIPGGSGSILKAATGVAVGWLQGRGLVDPGDVLQERAAQEPAWSEEIPAEQEEEPMTLAERVRVVPLDDPQVMHDLIEAVQFSSPIVIDWTGPSGDRDGAPTLTSAAEPAGAVSFDLDGDGAPELVQWLRPGADAWLAEDVDGDGRITSGRELFGTADGHANGFHKLAARDADGDGWVAGAELRGLLLWRERRADGVSDADELTPAHEAGLRGVRIPARGLTSEVLVRGERRPCWDVFPATWGPAAPAD